MRACVNFEWKIRTQNLLKVNSELYTTVFPYYYLFFDALPCLVILGCNRHMAHSSVSFCLSAGVHFDDDDGVAGSGVTAAGVFNGNSFIVVSHCGVPMVMGVSSFILHSNSFFLAISFLTHWFSLFFEWYFHGPNGPDFFGLLSYSTSSSTVMLVA